MYSLKIQLIKSQIAFTLRVPIAKIKTVAIWANVYFVTFWNAKARFVSKKGIVEDYSQETETKADEPTVSFCKVKAHTEIRQKGYKYLEAGKQRGLLLKDLKTGEEFWQNNNRLDLCDPLRGATVKLTEWKHGGYNIQVI